MSTMEANLGTTAAPTPETPTTTAPATGGSEHHSQAQPRDKEGRFSVANIRKAAGLPPEEPVAPTANAAVASPSPENPQVQQNAVVDPSAAPSDPIAALDALLAEGAPAAIATPDVHAQPQQPQQQSWQPAQTVEAQQAAIWAQNPQMAAQAVQSVQQLNAIQETLRRGDMDSFLGMLDPGALELLQDHLYRKNAATYAQRFVDEQNGVRSDPRVDAMARQVAALSQALQARTQQEQQARQSYQQQQREQQISTALGGYIDKLFAIAPEVQAQRKWLEPVLRDNLRQNPQALANIRAGRFGEVGQAFRTILQDSRSVFGAPVSQPQTAKPQSASTQLMTTPSGTSVTSNAPETPSLVENGKVTGKGIVARLRAITGNKAS